MNERIGVHAFDGCCGTERPVFAHCKELGRFAREIRPEAFAAAKRRVPHGFCNTAFRSLRHGEQTVQKQLNISCCVFHCLGEAQVGHGSLDICRLCAHITIRGKSDLFNLSLCRLQAGFAMGL